VSGGNSRHHGKEKDIVTVVEAIGNGDELGYCSSEQTSLNKDRGCGKTVTSYYTSSGGALAGHNGWVGYYKPILK